MENDLLIFSFAKNISSKVCKDLKYRNKLIINSSKEDIDILINFINIKKFQYILGLGYYHRKVNKLRLETKCKNKFKNEIIKKSPTEIEFIRFIINKEFFEIGKAMGNSFCNLVSFKILNSFENIKYDFIHISANFDVKTAVYQIEKAIDEIKNSEKLS